MNTLNITGFLMSGTVLVKQYSVNIRYLRIEDTFNFMEVRSMKIVSVLIAVLFTFGLFLSVPASICIAQEKEGTEIELQDEEQGSEYDREIEELRQEDLEEDLREESEYNREIEELQQEEEGEENAPEEEEQNYPDEKYQEDRG